jgi:hypothetical protein
MFYKLRVGGAEVLVTAYRGLSLVHCHLTWKWILSNDPFIFQTGGHIEEM